jgi:hypothetical protein
MKLAPRFIRFPRYKLFTFKWMIAPAMAAIAPIVKETAIAPIVKETAALFNWNSRSLHILNIMEIFQNGSPV